MSHILCVIPVRSGSKGVPGKNIKDLGGKPLVAWTIEQALAAKCGLDVLVSTDSEEIASVARSYGADVPFLRPAELSEDTTPTEPVVEHAIEFRRKQGIEADAVMLLQATSPLRRTGTLDAAVQQFEESGADSLIGVVPISPFIWELPTAEEAAPTAAYDVANRLRRQDMSPHDLRYRENGSLYITKTEIYDRLHNRIGGSITLFPLADIEGVDIDTDIDFRLAELQMADYVTRKDQR